MVSVGARKTDTKLWPNSHLGGRDRHQNRHRARTVIFREGDLDADSKAYSRDQEDSGGRSLAFRLAQAGGQALCLGSAPWDILPGVVGRWPKTALSGRRYTEPSDRGATSQTD